MTTEERARTLATTHAVEHGGQRVLDPEVIAYLCDINEEGDALLVELIELFQVDAAARVHCLLTAADKGDLAEVVRVAHALKNASATIGALVFASTCRELEGQASGEGDVSRLVVELEGMFAEVVSVLSELKSVCRPVPPSDQATTR